MTLSQVCSVQQGTVQALEHMPTRAQQDALLEEAQKFCELHDVPVTPGVEEESAHKQPVKKQPFLAV